MTILIFGDSITQGFHDTVYGGWCNLLVTEAMQRTIESDYKKDLSVFNLGISGNNSEDLLDRFKNESAPRAEGETVIVFAIGVNDSLYELHTGSHSVPLEKFKENINILLQQAKVISEKIYILGLTPVVEIEVNPIPWNVAYGLTSKAIQNYDSALENIAENAGAIFISMSDVWRGEVGQYLTDGLHPNAEGHKKMFERVREVFIKDGIL